MSQYLAELKQDLNAAQVASEKRQAAWQVASEQRLEAARLASEQRQEASRVALQADVQDIVTKNNYTLVFLLSPSCMFLITRLKN